MIVERMGKTKATIGSIKVGECFIEDGDYYMRTDIYTARTNECRCVSITTGICVYFMVDYYVEPVTAKAVIEV